MSTEDDRNVRIKRNGIGYVLDLDGNAFRITPGEALGLLTSLLHTLPEVPEGVRLAHHIRHGPRVTIRRLWVNNRNVVRQEGFQAFTYVAGKLIDRCDRRPTIEAALALASERYGCDLEVSSVQDAPGSKKFATERAWEWCIKDYLTSSGQTVNQLFQTIQAGETPEGFKEVTVDEQ